jgi:YHS domain-containing protein
MIRRGTMPGFEGNPTIRIRPAKNAKLNARSPQAAFTALGLANRTDPVCKNTGTVVTADITSQYNGTTYSFCSQKCKTEFDENPPKYLS